MSSENPDAEKYDSGRLWFDAATERICYESQHYGTWDVALRDVRVIGEYTNDQGPFVDDYFFVFVLDREGWYEASFYATGRDEFFKQLSAAIGSQLSTELVTSTDYRSNVLWPPEIAGTELFTLRVSDPAARGLLYWLWTMFAGRPIELRLSPEVLRVLPGEGFGVK